MVLFLLTFYQIAKVINSYNIKMLYNNKNAIIINKKASKVYKFCASQVIFFS